MNLYNVLSNRYVGMSNFERLFAQKFGGTGGKIKELEGVPPLTFTANGQPLIDYLISGNTVQTGTPTPENPIVPNGCGERMENLFDKDNYNLIRANAGTGQGQLYGDPRTAPYAIYIPVTGGETYSFYSQAALSSSCFTKNTPAIGVSITLNGANTFGTTNVRPAPADAKYLVMFLEAASVTQDKLDSDLATLTIVKSSTAPTSYIPYGYKLPISSAGQGVDIYLGEVRTTRRIKKLVLTGNESWHIYNNSYYITVNDYYRMYDIGSHLSACSHYPNEQKPNLSEMHYGLGGIVDGQTHTRWNGNIVFNPSPTISSLTDWKSYLAAQYAAGTPVTIWYVLAEPETGIVNEPLMKIGDYADTVSMEQAEVSIPTNKGSTTLDVDTTIKPSNEYIKYIN